jgi:hypothetical protein
MMRIKVTYDGTELLKQLETQDRVDEAFLEFDELLNNDKTGIHDPLTVESFYIEGPEIGIERFKLHCLDACDERPDNDLDILLACLAKGTIENIT